MFEPVWNWAFLKKQARTTFGAGVDPLKNDVVQQAHAVAEMDNPVDAFSCVVERTRGDKLRFVREADICRAAITVLDA